jgi:hypothetical protein
MKTTFQKIARSAIQQLVGEMIHGEFPANWRAIDTITARWPQLAGEAYAVLDAHRAARARAERKQAKRLWARENASHTMRNPYAIQS